MSDEKTCGKCGETKPLDEFYDHSGKRPPRDGKRGRCKNCDIEARRERIPAGEADPYQLPKGRGLLLAGPEPWMDDRGCKGYAPNVFFPPQGGDFATPRRICLECSVRSECLDYALRHNLTDGFFGGKSGKERRKLVRDQRQRSEVA